MVISDKHRYVFIQLPRTGSTAIARELCENYDGVQFLHKHATYVDFLKAANDEEKAYFSFSCLRNPLDDAVSAYLKFKSDHKSNYTDPEKLKRRKSLFRYVELKRFNFIQDNDADFAAFFLKFYTIPYNNWSDLSHRELDFVIRFENLVDDFGRALELIGIEQKRALPWINKTAGKGRGFLSYYTPETIGRAKRVFGPFMKEWDYEFPPAWGQHAVPWWNQLEFEFFNLFRRFYWRYLR